jgi:hypothetical protein
MTRMVGLCGREASAASCVRSTSRAAAGDVATTTGTSPSLRYMSGASSRRARSASARCASGLPRRWCRLPITGSRHGPGGSLIFLSPSSSAPRCLLSLTTSSRSGSRRARKRKR